jgi:hypothetical protein
MCLRAEFRPVGGRGKEKLPGRRVIAETSLSTIIFRIFAKNAATAGVFIRSESANQEPTLIP